MQKKTNINTKLILNNTDRKLHRSILTDDVHEGCGSFEAVIVDRYHGIVACVLRTSRRKEQTRYIGTHRCVYSQSINQ